MNAVARLRGLFAMLLITALLVGLPWVLLTLGAPSLPSTWTPMDLWAILTSPDDGTLAVTVIKITGWIAWAVLAFSLLVEIAAQARHIEPPHLRGLTLPQHAARNLVATAALLFIVGGHVGQAVPASAAPPTSVAATPQAPQVSTETPRVATLLAATTRSYTVQPGDSLWRIAEAHLGDGHRYTELVELNHDLLGGKADFLMPGWTLQLPSDGDVDTVTVQPGDTLSAIARAHFNGDESAYHQIFDASKDLVQPDGQHLSDPDMILPGWHLKLSDTATSATVAPATVAPATAATPDPAPVTSTLPSSTTRAAHERAETQDDEATSNQASAPAVAPTTTAPVTASPATNPAVVATPELPQVPWLVVGLVGGGGILAGSLLRVLARRRAAQFRARRPGRSIAAPPADLAGVEKTVVGVGGATGPTVAALDRVLRSLAHERVAAGETVPALAAVEIARHHILLHLAAPCELPEPWQGESSRTHWQLDAAQLLDATAASADEIVAPYPQLAAIGTADDGTAWLINAEEFGALAITGDPTRAADFIRHLVAGFAVNEWSRDLRVDLLNIGADVMALNPYRVRFHTDPSVLDDALRDAQLTDERLTDHAQSDITTARAADAGDDLWGSRVVIAHGQAGSRVQELQRLTQVDTSRTATSIFVLDDNADTAVNGVEIHLTATGRAHLPDFGLDLNAVRLTTEEAVNCCALLEVCSQIQEIDMPPMQVVGEGSWQANCNQAGQLRADLTVPRDRDDSQTAMSVLPATDSDYIDVAATTSNDLDLLAPGVTPEIRDLVEKADPTLDADVAAWFDPTSTVPKLTTLGPVNLSLGAGGNATAVASRKAYYLELVVFLGLHPEGVTKDQIAEAMGLSPDRVRNPMSVLRDWLGKNPATGRLHVPESTQSLVGRARGINLYSLEDVLVDADLFRRLRSRGEARANHGITDLRTALKLVQGRPLDQLRDNGGLWLLDDRADQVLTCGVVDVAHVVATDALYKKDYAVARAVAELASLVAPYDEISHLDLAAIATAEGRFAEADRILRSEVCQRSDEDGAHLDLTERATRIIQGHGWLQPQKAAS